MASNSTKGNSSRSSPCSSEAIYIRPINQEEYLIAYCVIRTSLRSAAFAAVVFISVVVQAWGGEQAVPVVRNAGFEATTPGDGFAANWQVEIGGHAEAEVALDAAASHSGARSVRIVNHSPMKANAFASFFQGTIPVVEETTYEASFFARGKNAKRCFLSVGFERGGDQRLYLTEGDFDWESFTSVFTTPKGCSFVSLRFASDDTTEAFWIDDVSIARSPRQWANLPEHRERRPFQGVFPRPPETPASPLLVYDCSKDSDDIQRMVTVLQGLVNRKCPRLYLLNPTNPSGYDEDWLAYLRECGYVDKEERVASYSALLERFRDAVKGIIVFDAALPGSIQAACMLSGLEDALPATETLAETLGLPILMDLRGRWTRNVDAYRELRDMYWNRFNHHVLAWMYPCSRSHCVRDYLAAFKVFTFWVSSFGDREQGGDPAAEQAFLNELLASTPANIPVMGWPMYGDRRGINEYEGVRWLSGFGKFVPGTEFCSNLTVHSAIRPEASALRQRFRESRETPLFEPGKVYLSVNILDSGDSLWYWQFHQRKIWTDPVRGSVPTGWCMNITLQDTLPAVLQWYVEHATPNDVFFTGASGLGYMNTQVYASRFGQKDRERIWSEYVRLTDRYCRALDIDGIELYNGSWGERTPPDEKTFARFAEGMKHLNYVIADLGRHECVTPDTANACIGNTAVFHTLTQFQVWSSSSETLRNDMANANTWLINEIVAHTPTQRPGFMSAMAISWYYYPAWLQDLAARLPQEYVLVRPDVLAGLYRHSQQTKR